jgi:hypothetical protein
MTVSELITRLQACNPNDEVEFSDEEGEIAITDIEEEPGYVFLCAEEEDEEIVDEGNEDDT